MNEKDIRMQNQKNMPVDNGSLFRLHRRLGCLVHTDLQLETKNVPFCFRLNTQHQDLFTMFTAVFHGDFEIPSSIFFSNIHPY